MSDYTVERYTVSGATITIEYDTDPSSPREWDNFGLLSMFHRKYTFPNDITLDGSPLDPSDFSNWKEMESALLAEYAIVLPVYMYEHSGVALSCGSFACPWDSGQVGFVACRASKILEEDWGEDGSLARAASLLRAEVDTYGQYINGEVYGYTVEYKGKTDSCWGFYGLDYCKESAEDAALAMTSAAQKDREDSLVTSAD